MSIFVTVGTTRFDELVQVTCSEEFQKAATRQGYTEIILQYGHSNLPSFTKAGLAWQTFAFTNQIDQFISKATLVIGHGGAGTILDVLRGPIIIASSDSHATDNQERPSLVIVPNRHLMDDHQVELAYELEKMGVAIVTSIERLSQCLPSVKSAQRTLIGGITSNPHQELPPLAISQLTRLMREALS